MVRKPIWLLEAEKHVGLKEKTGSAHEKEILKFFKDVGHSEIKNDETAWCRAFVGAMLERTGYNGKGALTARSALQLGERLTKPRCGCLVVFKRGNSTWQGHVAFYLDETPTHIRVLGGNQSNAVTIAKYPRKDVLGYVWPKPKESAPAKPIAQTGSGQGSVTAGVGGAAVVGGAIADASYQVQEAQGQISTGTWIGIAFGVIIILAVGYGIYSQWSAAGRPKLW